MLKNKALAHAKAIANALHTTMKTFHDWLAMRTEGLWLNDKLAVPGMSNINPLLKEKPKKPKPLPTLKPLKAKQPATLKPYKPAQAVKS